MSEGEILVREFEIVNKRGLHARASAKFVTLVSSFDALLHVEKDGMKVGGCCITVSASGPEAGAALTALGAMIADKFGEGE
jgi:phosphocarrier protein HPr